MRPMIVPVLHGATMARPDEVDTLHMAEAVADALRKLGHKTEMVHLGVDFGALAYLRELGPDIVFNLVDAVGGDIALAAVIPDELAARGLRFTGCGSLASRLCLSKPGMKRILAEAGLPTPDWSLSGIDLDKTPQVIVKSACEHASLGLDAGSVVPGHRASAEIAARKIRFGGSFFAETFIPGREFNIALLAGTDGPEMLPPAEIVFVDYADDRPHIVDYDAKWDAQSHAYWHTPRRFDFPSQDAGLLARLRDLAVRAWALFALDGYARVDFRVDEGGQPWILEINTNPCLTPDAGFAAAAAVAGMSYQALIARIVTIAMPSARKVA